MSGQAEILALDLAISTGWAELLPGGTIRSGTETLYGDPHVRLGNLLVWLESRIPSVAIVIEKPFLRGRNTFILVSLAGVATAVAKKHGLEFAEYPNATVKLAVTGSGKADKDAMRKLVQAQTGIRANTDDESDAIGVLLCHLRRRSSPLKGRT